MSEEIKKLVKKNLEINQEMHEMLKSIKKFIVVQRVFSFLKLLIIVVPIVLGLIYLPPLWEKYIPKFSQSVEQYRNLLNFGGGSGEVQTEISPEQLKNLSSDQIKKIQEIIKK